MIAAIAKRNKYCWRRSNSLTKQMWWIFVISFPINTRSHSIASSSSSKQKTNKMAKNRSRTELKTSNHSKRELKALNCCEMWWIYKRTDLFPNVSAPISFPNWILITARDCLSFYLYLHTHNFVNIKTFTCHITQCVHWWGRQWRMGHLIWALYFYDAYLLICIIMVE